MNGSVNVPGVSYPEFKNHKHTAEEVGARPNTWMPSAENVGARPNTWMPSAADVGAAAADHGHKPSDIGAVGYVGLLSNIGDFNLCTTNGFYLINETALNAPRYGFGILLSLYEIYATQVAFYSDGSIWHRSGTSLDKMCASAWNQVQLALGYTPAMQAEYTTTLPVSSWADYGTAKNCVISVAGLLATDTPIVDVQLTGDYTTIETDLLLDEEWSKIYHAAAVDGGIMVVARETPTIDLPIKIKVVR